jgi:hypothetical protein
MASALLAGALRHDAERVIRARMASPTQPAGMRGHASRAAMVQGSPKSVFEKFWILVGVSA